MGYLSDLWNENENREPAPWYRCVKFWEPTKKERTKGALSIKEQIIIFEENNPHEIGIGSVEISKTYNKLGDDLFRDETTVYKELKWSWTRKGISMMYGPSEELQECIEKLFDDSIWFVRC